MSTSLARAAGPRSSHLDEDSAERDDVWQAILQLPARQRAAVVLRFYEDLSERKSAPTVFVEVKAVPIAPFVELLIDCEEDRTLLAVLVGMLREDR